MRRWVCVIALLFGFTSDGYVWLARPRSPVPIERLLDPAADPANGLPAADWWLLP